MTQVFDLIVIGAGPGGSNAASVALRHGLSVAQLERATFPRCKPCAGGLTNKSLAALTVPDPPGLRSAFPTFECNVWTEDLHRLHHRNRVLSMVVRPEFDNQLVERNRLQPAFSFFDGEPAREIHFEGLFLVVTPSRTLVGRQLVAADGASGIVNREFGVSRIAGRALALEVNLHRDQAKVQRSNFPCVDLFFLNQGYGWVFPKGDSWTVGLYTLSRPIQGARKLLLNYLHAKGFMVNGDPLESFEAYPIPIGGFRIQVPEVPVYVVGDAGGFAEAILGEGIFYALESGRLAGLAAVSRALHGGSHRQYYQALRRRVLPDTFLSYFLARLIYTPHRGSVWHGLKRLSQRLFMQGYAEGATITQTLIKGSYYLPKSFREVSLEVLPTFQGRAV